MCLPLRAGLFWLACGGGACGAEAHTSFYRIQSLIVDRTSDKTLSELRIARAYIKLLCTPEGNSQTSISLARIGDYEIRIFEGSQTNSNGTPLFWLELFDHGAQRSVDSFSCHKIEDAVVEFEDFISQAEDALGPDGKKTQS
jgi:hypothetical protein